MNGCEQPVQLGVNWAGIGTVSIDKAKDFATAISNAAGLAEGFIYAGYMVEY